MPVPYTFANATTAIPLSQLDSNFGTAITLGNTAIQLGNTVTTLNNMTLANVTISSGTVSITNVAVTTANVSGTANISTLVVVGNTTAGGNVSVGGNVSISVNTSVSGNASVTGNISGAGGSFSSVTSSGNVTLSGGTANGVLYLNGSKVATSGTALVFNGTVQTIGSATSQNSLFKQVIGSGGANEGLVIVSGATGKGWVGFNNSNTAGIPGQVTYDHNTGTLGLYADGGPITFSASAAEGMRLTSTGLGIGTSSPATQLDVSSSTGTEIVTRRNGGRTVNTYADGVNAILAYSTGALRIGETTSTVGANFTERMRLDASGNLGLGVTPSAWSSMKSIQVGTAASFSGGSGYNDTFIASNAYFNGTNWIYINGNPAYYTSIGGTEAARWYTAASGTAGTAITFSQAMTLDSSGNLLVGQTSQSQTGLGFSVVGSGGGVNSGTVSCGLNSSSSSQVTYVAYSTSAAAYRFYVDMAGTVHATNTTITGISDVRLKENIRDLDDGLDVVMALKPRKFDWKEGKGQNIKNARGFIAQEFEQVLPDMVEEWRDPAPEGEDPYKAVNANLIPTLVKALQEQQAQIESLRKRLADAGIA